MIEAGMARASESGAVASPTLGRRIWRRFLRHRLGVTGLGVLALLYLMVLLGPFLAPYSFDQMHREFRHAPPTRIHFVDQEGRFHWRPFVYGLKTSRDPITFQFRYEEDTSRIYPIRFLVPGEPYRLFGLIPARLRLFGLDPGSEGRLFLLGTDRFGRDLWGRVLLGGRVTLTVGILGVGLSTVIGVVMGGDLGLLRRPAGRPDPALHRAPPLLSNPPAVARAEHDLAAPLALPLGLLRRGDGALSHRLDGVGPGGAGAVPRLAGEGVRRGGQGFGGA